MEDAYWKNLKCEECCFTCQHNRNVLRKDFPCNCEFENRKDNTSQDMWCGDYDLHEEE